MKARVSMSFSSSTALTGDELIAVVQRIHEGFAKLGQSAPKIVTGGDRDGTYRVSGSLETDVEFDS